MGTPMDIPQSDSFRLVHLSADKITECAHVAGLAFEEDRHTQFKAHHGNADPYNHEEGMKGALNHWSRKSDIEVTMAVSNDDKRRVLGWIAWAFHNFDSSASPREQQKQPQRVNDREEPKSDAPATKTVRQRLEAYTSSDMQSWMSRLMPPGTKCMYICSIVVHPDFQAHGVGSTLIRQGTRRADAEGVFCWVHASEAGAEFFSKQGFEQVGSLELDLDEWNSESLQPPEGEGARWGRYTFRYLKRECRSTG